jgi:prevent-host-death family protein
LDTTVSIGEVKRDISELVNRVAYGHERIVLTSRGKPKAALVSLDDYARLQVQEEMEQRQSQQTWFRRAEELSARILRERNGEPVDVELIVREAKLDLELRFDDLLEQ